MIKERWWYGNYSGYPAPPAWTKDYAHLAIHGYGLDKSYRRYRYLFAFNTWKFTSGSNATYGTWHNTVIVDGKRCQYNYDTGKWNRASSASGEYLYDEYPYNTTEEGTVWSSVDIPCVNDAGEERIVITGSPARYFILEYGWADGGKDDNEKLGSDTQTSYEFIQGWSVAGDFRCIGKSSNEEDVLTFKWYKDGVLVSEQTGGTYADCKPSEKETGTFSYYCVVTNADGASLQTDTLTVEVIEDTSDDTGGDSGDYIEKESYVTAIILNPASASLYPGEQVTIGVTLEGMGNYSRAFSAQMSGNLSSNTTLSCTDTSCTVVINQGETADDIIVAIEASGVMEFAEISIRHDTPERLRAAYWKGFAAAKALQGGYR